MRKSFFSDRFNRNLIFSWGLALCCLSSTLYSARMPIHAQDLQDAPLSSEIFFGPGLINSCKQIILQGSSTIDGQESSFNLSDGQPSFRDAKFWIAKNVFTSLNRSGYCAERASKYSLHLFSGKNNGMMGLLVSVPLGPAILGPEYEHKLEELRKIMSAKQ